MSKRLTAAEATDRKLALFRLASQLVANDVELRTAADGVIASKNTLRFNCLNMEYRTLTEVAADPTLDRLNVVKDTEDPNWFISVGELRALVQPQHDQVVAGAYAPPDPYAKDLAALRSAEATPESTFEEEWKKRRLAGFEAEARQRDAHVAAHPLPRMRASELADYEPPDPYAAGIKALQAKESRR